MNNPKTDYYGASSENPSKCTSYIRALKIALGVVCVIGVVVGIVLGVRGRETSELECPVGEWVKSDEYNLYDTFLKYDVPSKKACADLVAKECPGANIANFGENSGACWCQYHSGSLETFEENGDEEDYESCRMTTEGAKIPWKVFCNVHDMPDDPNDPLKYGGSVVKMCQIKELTDAEYPLILASSTIRDIEQLDVSTVEDFTEVFYEIGDTNFDLSEWNVGNGKTFSNMFYSATQFNSSLSSWDVGNGENFRNMFQNAKNFESDLSTWDVGNGKDFNSMFQKAWIFNSDLSTWDVRNGKDFGGMFNYAYNFNSDISTWNVENGETFTVMFAEATVFNSDLSSWNVSKGANFQFIFEGADAFKSGDNVHSVADWDVCGADGKYDAGLFRKNCSSP